MKIKQFEVAGLAQYSYVVSSDGEAIVIDPMRDFDRYIAYVQEQGLTIRYVTETHIHADFASGAPALSAATGAELALSAHVAAPYRYLPKHRALRDGDTLRAGNIRLSVVHTPGHTPEHLSFILYDEARNVLKPVALFSGDFLFVGSLGRPDLLGDDAKEQLAHELYLSLHERIAFLPDGVQVYPGHGAGSLCGSGMSERAESTLGYEREAQPLFKLDEEAFVHEILASVPAMPAYYPRMKELNAKGASSVATLPGGKALTVAEVAALSFDADVAILDLRRPEAFGGAHLPGAINIGASQNLSLWAGWMIGPDKRLVLVNDQGDDEESRRALVRVGLDRIEGFLHKGTSAWIEAGLEFMRTMQLSATEVNERGGDAQIVDVRNKKEWASGHIQHAIHVPLGELPQRAGEISDQSPVITICGSGYRSSIAASLLQAQGFCNVSSMDGGMIAWNRRKLPTAKP